MKQRGFTLIELLVVIAVIAVLMGILMPALQIAKKKAQGTVCSSRQKQLVLAWVMYADDNNDKIVNSDTRMGNKGYWVKPPQNESGSAVGISSMTLEDRKRGIKAGALYPYIKSVEFYHCPADERRRYAENSPECAYRSFSIPSGLNSDWAAPKGGADHVAYKNRSNLKRPSEALVFLEEGEREKGFNHHSWALWITRPEFYDPLAIFHGGSSTMGYADGHAQSYRWRTREVIDMFEKGRKSMSVNPSNEDYLFLKEHYPVKSIKK